MFFIFSRYAPLLAQALIGGSLLLPVVLYLSHCMINLFRKTLPPGEELLEEKDFAVIVDATERAQNIESLVQSLLNLNYTNYLIYLVTNSNVYNYSDKDKIVVLPLEKSHTNQLRLYRFVIENFKRPHTHLAILGNGVAHNEYFNQLNVFFNKGYQAVQGAHSLQQSHSFYDLIYLIGNRYQRIFKNAVPFQLRASATLAGCGAAFNVSLFKQCLKRMSRSRSGVYFMQEIEGEMVSRGYRIAYASNAVVFGDKPIEAGRLIALQAQNMNRWFLQFMRNSRMLSKGIVSFDFNLVLSGLLRLQPSLFTTLLLSVFCLLSNALMRPAMAVVWMGGLLLFLSCFFIAVVNSANSGKSYHRERFFTSLPMSIFLKKRRTEAA